MARPLVAATKTEDDAQRTANQQPHLSENEGDAPFFEGDVDRATTHLRRAPRADDERTKGSHEHRNAVQCRRNIPIHRYVYMHLHTQKHTNGEMIEQ